MTIITDSQEMDLFEAAGLEPVLRPDDLVEVRMLTVWQPWVWLMFHPPEGIRKDIENRSWSASYRGKLYIHASKRIAPYELVREITDPLGIALPAPEELELGKVIGSVMLTDILDAHEQDPSPWFDHMGKGWVIESPEPLDEPYPYTGQQGLYRARLPRGVVE